MGQHVAIGGSEAEAVRELWTAFERNGLQAMLELVPPDVEWAPVAAGERVLHGSDEIRAFWSQEEASGHREQAVAYRFEQDGDAVLVSGSLRQFAAHGWSDSQPLWVFFFSNGQLRRAQGFRSRSEALEAVDAHNAAG
jgi:limonene-1,2-epoxide hydrolase